MRIKKLLEGKVAFVSGGNEGIGEASVYALAENGAKVVFCGRNAENGRRVEENAKERGYDVLYIEADMEKLENNRMVIEKTVAHFGRIDIVLANAGGGGGHKMMVDMTPAIWKHDTGIYIHSPYLLSKYAIEYMKAQRTGGSIIFMSSASAFKLSPKQGGYGVGKSAQWQMARQISLEYCREGIRANSILPAATKTKMISNPDVADMVKARANARKYNELEDVTNAVVYLASDLSRAVTSTQILVDFASSAGTMPDLIVGGAEILSKGGIV